MDSTQNPRGYTPRTWNAPDDARRKPSTYPNYWIRKTRSGHEIRLDDTDGNEHISIQHRSGTLMQFLADGHFMLDAKRGRTDVTYGEHRSYVTGAYDKTVIGDMSAKVHANQYNTIYGNKGEAVKGDFAGTYKSHNMNVAEQMDISTGTMTTKINNSSSEQALGAMSKISTYGMTLASLESALGMAGKTGIGILSGGGIGMQAKGGNIAIRSDGNITQIEGEYILLNCGNVPPADSFTPVKPVPAPKKEPVPPPKIEPPIET